MKTRQFGAGKYVGDPLNAVKIFNEKQVDELTFLDIDASVKGRPPDLGFLRSLAIESRMPLCYGGGVDSAFMAAEIVSLGYEKVSVSSAALARPRLISEMADAVGCQSVVVTVDVRRNRLKSGYSIYSHNGKQRQSVPFLEFVRQVEALGAGEIVVNSIDRDGEMTGYDLALARVLRDAVSCPISVAGGARSVDDLQELIDTVGVVGAVAGSLFVFRGPYRAVLINYARPERLN